MDSPESAKMREELFMSRRKRRQFTPEFKAEAVRLAQVGDRSIGQVAIDLDLRDGNCVSGSDARKWMPARGRRAL